MADIFLPKILLRGEKSIFFLQCTQRPFELVGQIDFFGESDGHQFNILKDGNFSINGKIQNYKELPKILRGVDYVVFTNFLELKKLKGALINIGCASAQLVSMREFFTMNDDAFYDLTSDAHLLAFMKSFKPNTLLDVNAHFAKSGIFTKSADILTEIDVICDENFFQIKNNIYSRVYKTFSECHLKHYATALIYVTSSQEFDKNFSAVEHCTDVIITFAKYNSELEKHIMINQKRFKEIRVLGSFSGNWFICYLNKPAEDFAMYVVTHKKLPVELVENLPADYKIIHAGKTLSENLGYDGDDSGENISRLNPYINELTALYWMWKNTSESIIGLSHYRRFFTSSNDEKNFMSYADRNFEYEKILTKEQAVNILRDFDIITTKPAHRHTIWYEDLNDNLELTDFALSTVRKHLMRVHPEYVDAFDYLVKTSHFYCKNMFVTRRYVFNAYCEWFFSFYLDATREVLNSDVYKKSADKTARLMGYLAERIQTVWLMKNHLRIKELFIIEKFDIA